MNGPRDAVERYAFVPPRGGRAARPLEIVRAEGASLFTADGREILDAAGGAIVCNVGHGRAEVAQAAFEATVRESYVVPVFATPSRVALVERLHERWLPGGLEHVYLTSGGSESVDAALRLARQHFVAKGEPSRWKVIGRELSYHGTTLATLSAGGHEKRRAPFLPMLHDWPKAPAHYCYRCPLGLERATCATDCVDAIEATILRAGPASVAAVVAEPVVGSTAGALDPPDDYWPRLAEICRRHGVLLIADEVMSGFGRTGRPFAVDHFDVVPDILVGGKGLAGGYAPIGGVYATEEVVAPLSEAGDELMFYTFGAHSGACAAANAVLDILEREDLVARAARVGEQLRKRLAILESHPHVGEIRGRGLLLGVELVRDAATREPFPVEARFAGRVVAAGLAEGVFFYPGGAGAARDVVLLGPPFIIDDTQIERIASVLERAIDAAAAKASG